MTDMTFDEAVLLVKSNLHDALSSAPLIIRRYTEHLSKTSGKFIRAISLISCAQNQDGLIPENAVKCAVAVELLHLATLVHDDVIDNAGKRRGITTLQKKFGKRTAVICGDYLFCLALKTIGDISDKEKYLNLNVPNFMEKICLGELNQHINNKNLNLSVRDYLKIISGKTAALFEASFYAGAVMAGCDNENLKKYSRLGRYIGMIFQLTDDCIDFEIKEDVAKKPVWSDFEQGVITLPLIYAFKNAPDFKNKAKSGTVTRADINDTVINTGGIKHTKLLSKKYYNKCLKIIDELTLAGSKRKNILNILNKAYYGLSEVEIDR